MIHPLDGPLMKLARAEHHVRDLTEQILAFNALEPHSIIVTPDGRLGWFVATAKVARPIPTTLSLVVGDAFHNMRAALDHLIWELSLAHWRANPTTPEPRNRVEFPIYWQQPSKGSRFFEKVRSLSPRDRALVAGVQPFVAPTVEEAQRSALHLLNEIDAWDKHKRVGLIFCAVSRLRCRFRLKTGETVAQDYDMPALVGSQSYVAFEHGQRLASLALLGEANGVTFTAPVVNVGVSAAVHVAFGHETAGRYLPVLTVAESCLHRVREILEMFRPSLD